MLVGIPKGLLMRRGELWFSCGATVWQFSKLTGAREGRPREAGGHGEADSREHAIEHLPANLDRNGISCHIRLSVPKDAANR